MSISCLVLGFTFGDLTVFICLFCTLIVFGVWDSPSLVHVAYVTFIMNLRFIHFKKKKSHQEMLWTDITTKYQLFIKIYHYLIFNFKCEWLIELCFVSEKKIDKSFNKTCLCFFWTPALCLSCLQLRDPFAFQNEIGQIHSFLFKNFKKITIINHTDLIIKIEQILNFFLRFKTNSPCNW